MFLKQNSGSVRPCSFTLAQGSTCSQFVIPRALVFTGQLVCLEDLEERDHLPTYSYKSLVE